MVFVVNGTQRFLECVGTPVAPPVDGTTLLGPWYATAARWRPQTALFVNEATLLPVFLPLAPVRRAAEVISPRMRALVLLSIGTGLRQGEALGLTVDRVNLVRREVIVDRQLVKNVGQPPLLGPLKTPGTPEKMPSSVTNGRRRWIAVAATHKSALCSP